MTASSIPAAILARISAVDTTRVWIPEDFADLGPRTAIDQAMSRLSATDQLRRIARGLYDKPIPNSLTGKLAHPNPRDVIDALTRRGNARILVDGMTAANDLGLTDAVPARVIVLTDGRLRPIALGNLTIEFKHVSPSRLYWAGRPAMRFVQALHWLRDMLPADDGTLHKRLLSVLNHSKYGPEIKADLNRGLSALPEWMRSIVRDLLQELNASPPQSKRKSKPKKTLARTMEPNQQIEKGKAGK